MSDSDSTEYESDATAMIEYEKMGSSVENQPNDRSIKNIETAVDRREEDKSSKLDGRIPAIDSCNRSAAMQVCKPYDQEQHEISEISVEEEIYNDLKILSTRPVTNLMIYEAVKARGLECACRSSDDANEPAKTVFRMRRVIDGNGKVRNRLYKYISAFRCYCNPESFHLACPYGDEGRYDASAVKARIVDEKLLQSRIEAIRDFDAKQLDRSRQKKEIARAQKNSNTLATQENNNSAESCTQRRKTIEDYAKRLQYCNKCTATNLSANRYHLTEHIKRVHKVNTKAEYNQYISNLFDLLNSRKQWHDGISEDELILTFIRLIPLIRKSKDTIKRNFNRKLANHGPGRNSTPA